MQRKVFVVRDIAMDWLDREANWKQVEMRDLRPGDVYVMEDENPCTPDDEFGNAFYLVVRSPQKDEHDVWYVDTEPLLVRVHGFWWRVLGPAGSKQEGFVLLELAMHIRAERERLGYEER